jgi:hypothetical protein
LSAFALALSITFLTGNAERRGVFESIVNASSTVLPRTNAATTPTLRGLMRTPFAVALTLI